MKEQLNQVFTWMRKNKNVVIAGLLTIIASFGMLFISQTDLFLTSIMMITKSDSFDGTTFPIKEIPDWDKITKEERWNDKNSLSPDIFVNIPKYDMSRLGIDWSKLTASVVDTAIRKEKITYTIPYLGDYSFSYKEGVGGHPGVDIITPPGTEIYAIANAVVFQASNTTGPGNYVVLRHDNVPDPSDPSKTTTLYSSYEHLTSFLIKKGDKVKKGQMIAFSGNTGNSTAPHLHFQIDLKSAPFHPYWPTNFEDPADSASQTTHPIKYAYKYENYASGSSQSTVATNTTSPIKTQPKTIPQTNDIDTPDANLARFVITNEGKVLIGSKSTFLVKAVDKDDKIITDYTGKYTVSLSASGLNGNFSKNILLAEDFNRGVAKATFTPAATGIARIIASSTLASGSSQMIITNSLSEIAASPSFPDVTKDHTNYNAIEYLKSKNIINGYSDGTFKPEKTVSRAELVKIILVAIGENVNESLKSKFSDVDTNQWYSSYVALAKKNGIVGGYPDGTFQPNKTVSRIEALKIILEAMNKNMQDPSSAPYTDTATGQWFSKYAEYTKSHNLIDTINNKLNPSKEMSRAEVAEIMYRLMK